ncbi:MAG TPA: hypothetical protein VIM55_11105 [Mucilaginibacter sp.]
MRTSLLETEQIEAHLLQRSAPAHALLFDAKLLLNDDLADKLNWQKATYTVIKNYGRNQLKKEIEAVHQSLFSEARHRSFSEKIRRIFSKK